jgi:hypothetical protein
MAVIVNVIFHTNCSVKMKVIDLLLLSHKGAAIHITGAGLVIFFICTTQLSWCINVHRNVMNNKLIAQ